MQLPRFSIGKLMVMVGLAAMNLAAGRALFSIEPWILTGLAPAGLALQLGVFRLIRSRGRARAFWVGFLAAGLLAACSLAGAMLFRTSVIVGIHVTTGQRITLTTPGSPAADRAWNAWAAYLGFAQSCLERLPHVTAFMGRHENVMAFLAGAVIAFLPQFLTALAGGLVASFVVWIMGFRHRHRLEAAV